MLKNYRIECEWGKKGIERLMERTDVFVIVDVVAYSSCVEIAVERGALVYPYHWLDLSAPVFCAEIGGVMAVSTRKAGYSLSPKSLLEIPAGTKLVLPSPNGATLSLQTGNIPTLAGSLRNASAVALAARDLGQRISVIACGERWEDGDARFAVEDWLGAGAVIDALEGDLSGEAELARLAFEGAKNKLEEIITRSISGQDLITRQRPEDIRLVADLNCSQCAPILRDHAFRPYVQS